MCICVCMRGQSLGSTAIQTWCSKNEISRQEFCQLCFYSHKQKGSAVQRVLNIHWQGMPFKKKKERKKETKQTRYLSASNSWANISHYLHFSKSLSRVAQRTDKPNVKTRAEARMKWDIRQRKKTQKNQQVRPPLFVFSWSEPTVCHVPTLPEHVGLWPRGWKTASHQNMFNKHLSRSHSPPRVNIAQPKTAQPVQGATVQTS